IQRNQRPKSASIDSAYPLRTASKRRPRSELFFDGKLHFDDGRLHAIQPGRLEKYFAARPGEAVAVCSHELADARRDQMGVLGQTHAYTRGHAFNGRQLAHSQRLAARQMNRRARLGLNHEADFEIDTVELEFLRVSDADEGTERVRR